MCKYPALPLFTDAWVADTCHLTRLERGTYADLLILMWRTPGCRVPNDDKWLARHMRMTLAEVETELRPLIEEFCQNTGNWITQKRLRKEYDYITAQREPQSVRAKSRWNNKIPYATLPTPTPIRRKEENFGLELEGKEAKSSEPELAQSAKDAITAHQARERELLDRERNPIKTVRGLELTKAWLERKGLPPTMEPLYKMASVMNGAAHVGDVIDQKSNSA